MSGKFLNHSIKLEIPMKIPIAFALFIGAVMALGQDAAQSPQNKAPQSENKALLLDKKVLSLAAARKMAAAAINEAEKNHWHGVVTIVDDGGCLILLERMDHAMRASVELAAGKARSAALFKKPSEELEKAINGGRYAAITARGFIEMQGGLPVMIDGEVVGAIGASFATPEEDVKVAQAGLAALNQ
jgi:glc operon protein GlcG